jgi:hypothetical protein
MKTINEIFESNPKLLEEKEVKELIEQFRVQFMQLKTKHHDYWDKVTSITLNSDLFVINGIPCKDAIEKINEISF